MAIYHLEVKTHSRTNDANAVKAAAYRAGTVLFDEANGRAYDFSLKTEVIHSEILAPRHAPEWIAVRSRLWHEVESRERYKNARLFREIVVALPIELSHEQCIALLREYITTELTSIGMVADYSIHAKPGNPHCHISLTTREISGAGFGKKNRRWDAHALLLQWRKSWAEKVNQHLEKAGCGPDISIDHRSFKDRGLTRMPTVHVGRKTPKNTRTHQQKIARNNRTQRINEARETIAHSRLQVMELEALKCKVLHANRAVNVLARAQRDEILTGDELADFASRGAFSNALGKRDYTRDHFDSDLLRMRDEVGGNRLRWWLLSFKEAKLKYPEGLRNALEHIPIDIIGWINRSVEDLGETEAFAQLTTAARANCARATVPWPGDSNKNVFSEPGPIMSISQSEPRKTNDLTITLGGPKHPTEVTEGIPLYSPTESMRFYEYNVKVCVPDANRLFRERFSFCKFIGLPYSWEDFYQEVVQLNSSQNPRASLLDWWSSTYRKATEKYSDMTLVRTRIPPPIRFALNRRLKEAVLARKHVSSSKPEMNVPPTEPSQMGGQFNSSSRGDNDHSEYSSGQSQEPLAMNVSDSADANSIVDDHPFRFNLDFPPFKDLQ